MKKQTISRSMSCGFLVIAFFLMPVNTVMADGYSSDADYWRWWYIEHQTDAITNGQGVSTENIQDTDSGQTAGTVIYNQSGVTRGELIDYVEEQYNQVEGYVQKGVEWYVNAVNNVYDSTVTAATKASYETEKAVREVVDSTGNVIVDVSGSDFWHSVYNGLFSCNGYKDIYADVSDGSYTATVGSYTCTFSFVGTGSYDYYYNNSNKINPTTEIFTSRPAFYSDYVPATGAKNYAIGRITYNNESYYFCIGSNNNAVYPYSDFNAAENPNNNTNIIVTCKYTNGNSFYTKTSSFWTNEAVSNVGAGGSPVLQPKQVGFIIYNGNRVPVYTDPSLNPFTINDDGTVDYNGTNYPVYVDPDEISPDGWLKILEYIYNEDQTQNPYNPQGQPWNTQPDGTTQAGLFSNLIKDISSMFGGIADKLSNLFKGLLDGILKALKNLFNIDFSQLNRIRFEVDFNIIQDVINKLLEMLGVQICFLI